MLNHSAILARHATQAASRPRRALVIHNPTAGRRQGRRLAQVMDHLDALGSAVTLVETGRRGDAEAIARSAGAADVDIVVAAGGDGTINEVVNGLVAGPGGLDLGIVPLGTANVLAHEVGLDLRDGRQIARTIAFGPTRTIHPGIANGRHFLLMAGIGLDAQVVENVASAMKRPGKLGYVMEGFRQALGYDFPTLEIRADGKVFEGAMAVACKGRFYGGPFVAAPAARLDQPRLHLCILPKAGAAGAMRYGLALPMGRLPALPDVQVVEAETIIIRGPRGAPVQGDGDIVARLPAEITVSQETISLAVPENI